MGFRLREPYRLWLIYSSVRRGRRVFGLFKKKDENNTKEKTSGFHWWLFKDEGTVAENRTMKEIWNDPEVQKEIAAFKRAFKNTKKTQSDN